MPRALPDARLVWPWPGCSVSRARSPYRQGCHLPLNLMRRRPCVPITAAPVGARRLPAPSRARCQLACHHRPLDGVVSEFLGLALVQVRLPGSLCRHRCGIKAERRDPVSSGAADGGGDHDIESMPTPPRHLELPQKVATLLSFTLRLHLDEIYPLQASEPFTSPGTPSYTIEPPSEPYPALTSHRIDGPRRNITTWLGRGA